MSRNRFLSMLMCFVTGVGTAIIVPHLAGFAANRILPEQHTEVQRATSPDGMVDAVLVESDCGAPCSTGYSVSLVPKGEAAPRDAAEQVLLAEYVVNPKIRWKESRLLEFAYDRALIHSFRNVEYPFARPGKSGSFGYIVEILLAPSSLRYSYLDSTGSHPAP